MYLLPGAELNQMLTLVVAIESETPCEPELLLFAMGPINYRPLKLLGSPGLIVEPPKHRTSIARIRLATPAQLRGATGSKGDGIARRRLRGRQVSRWPKIWETLWQCSISQDTGSV